MRQIVTFSRRTDPGPHMEWFLARVRQGETWVPNPYNNRPYRVSLRPEDVLLLNFWTKAPSLVVPHLEALRDFSLAFFITQTGYPRWIEPGIPEVNVTSVAIRELHEILGPERIWWRYDPILLSEILSPDWHRENFEKLCGDVWAGRTRRVIVSLAHVHGTYSKVRHRLNREFSEHGDRFHDEAVAQFLPLAADLTRIASEHGISLEICCSPGLTGDEAAQYGLRQARCISPEALQAIGIAPPKKSKPTRSGDPRSGYAPCGCLASRDIGANGTCHHGCIYCYANRRGVSNEPIASDAPWLSSKALEL